MKNYLRFLSFLKPLKIWIFSAFILTIFYIAFNSAALYITGTFVKTIFMVEPSKPEEVKNLNPATEPKTRKPQGIEGLLPEISIKDKIKRVVASYIERESKVETLKRICWVLIISFLLKNIMAYTKNVITGLIEFRVINMIREELYEHIHKLSMSFFDKTKSGVITSITINDVTAIKNMLRTSFEKVFLVPLEILAYLAWLIILSWKLTLYIFVIIPLIALVLTHIGASIRRKSKRNFAQVAEVLNLLTENLNAIRIVKAFAMEKYEIVRFQKENTKYYDLSMRQRKLSALTGPLNEVIGAYIAVLLLWFGGSEVVQGQGLGADDFMQYIIFLFMMFAPLRELSGLNVTIQIGLGAGDRVVNLLETKPEIVDKSDAKPISDFQKSINFSHATFSYKSKAVAVLQDIDLSVKKGQVVAFVGQSGAGKTTLVNLVPRFYDVTSGSISIDGVDIRDLQMHSLRRLMGIVTQESILFNDTVRANISYGVMKASEENIIKAAKVANAWEFIANLEKGLDTIIGERGVTLSGGQRQRLAIARAVLKNPPVLILDEATSALDTESEQLVQDALNSLMENRTVLVIAHRLSTIIKADKIVVLKDGKIVETGRHDELLSKNGYYKRLYELQFASEAE
ncbi:MAG: ABC transporter ATP-binding protein [Deferribacteres bacterium]|nr:ABC transporter ATP-binding protein [candidate division KSB1 bacterium]MCB9504408.1 ABC transporter ATP-binding protein [Deferribacteres bacterium]